MHACPARLQRKPVVKINGKRMMRDTTEAELLCRVYKQPVSVVIEANRAFSSYRKGVFTGPCGTRLNHAVLVRNYSERCRLLDR